MKIIAMVIVGVFTAIHLVAAGIYWFAGYNGLDDYGTIVMFTAIATGVVLPMLFSGRSSNDHLMQATAQHSEARFMEHDKEDAGNLISLGLIVALGAILAGGSGYLLTLLAA